MVMAVRLQRLTLFVQNDLRGYFDELQNALMCNICQHMSTYVDRQTPT
jgi:hypothetical protein